MFRHKFKFNDLNESSLNIQGHSIRICEVQILTAHWYGDVHIWSSDGQWAEIRTGDTIEIVDS